MADPHAGLAAIPAGSLIRLLNNCATADDYTAAAEALIAVEREAVISDLMTTTCINRGEAGRIYDAGYRKAREVNHD